MTTASGGRLRDLRLRRNTDIRLVFDSGTRIGDRYLRMVYRKSELSHPRFCISVSRKVARKAVDRNRIRRRMREVLRRELAGCARGMDLLVLPGREVGRLPWPELIMRSHQLLEKILAS